jgi:hypothetical protein
LWDWSYSAPGIAASGTLTTSDTANSQGFYLITDISGTRNGETLTGLQRVGTAIPGNNGYPVDNLIRATGPQMTSHGFGFSIPSKPGHTELPIAFTATISSASEPR